MLIIIIFCFAACNPEENISTAPSDPPATSEAITVPQFQITYSPEVVLSIAHAYRPICADAGDIITLRTGPVMDADLNLYYNNIKIEQTHAGSDYWEYQFIMPAENVYITNKIGSTPPDISISPAPSTLEYFHPQLAKLSADQVAQIETVTKSGGSYLQQTTSTRDAEDINFFLTSLKNVETGSFSDSYDPYPAMTVQITITLKDGSAQVLEFSNGICTKSDCRDLIGLYVQDLPQLELCEYFTTYFSFAVSDNSVRLTTPTSDYLLENLDTWKFESDVDFFSIDGLPDPLYTMAGAFGIGIVYTETVFEYNGTYYGLLDYTFSQMLEAFGMEYTDGYIPPNDTDIYYPVDEEDTSQ